MGLIAIYPGSFDPFTHGHCDIACRAAKLVDKLIIAVSAHSKKKMLFSPETRVSLIHESIYEYSPPLADKMEIVIFDNLLVDFVAEKKCDIVFRGLRATTDFEAEFQMASVNRKLDDRVDTVFLTASDKYHFISSSMVREISALGGDLSNYVSTAVTNALKEKFSS